MRLLSFSHDARHTFGVATDTGVIDLGARLGDRFTDLKQAIERDAITELQQAAAGVDADYSYDDIHFERPIRFPEKIICVGVNYMNRNEEYKDDSNAPAYPSIFIRTPESLVGHHAPIVRPQESEQLDYEGEIVIVIGKAGRRISEAQATSHIAGLTIMNEGTIRDWLRHAKFNVTQGKNFERSGSIGPWIVTGDVVEETLGGYEDLKVKTTVNGELRQSDTTANLAFPFHYLVSYISTFAGLKPGDIIATGTPTGAGARFDPPKFLKPGDRIDVEVEGIGTLTNSVVDE